MKKISLFFFLVCLCAGLSAQYKKASFFEKSGRTYGLSAKLFALGDGRGTPVGYTLFFGTDQDGKQWFSNYEITFLPSYSFSFATRTGNGTPITVSGKSKPNLILGYHGGYYLLKNENEEQKIKPYITAGLSFSTLGGPKGDYSDSWDNEKLVAEGGLSVGAGGGLGCIFNFTRSLAFKLEGGYTYQFNSSKEGSGAYHMLPKHPYASAGLRFRIISE